MMVYFSRTTTVTIRETLMFGKQFRTVQNNRRFLIFMLRDRRKLLTVVACVFVSFCQALMPAIKKKFSNFLADPMKFFITRVKANLHIILCLPPTHRLLRIGPR